MKPIKRPFLNKLRISKPDVEVSLPSLFPQRANTNSVADLFGHLSKSSRLSQHREEARICKNPWSPQNGKIVARLKHMLMEKSAASDKKSAEKSYSQDKDVDYSAIRNAVKPFITEILDKPEDVDTAERFLSLRNIKSKLLTEKEAETFDQIIEMLLNKTLSITKVVSRDNIEKLKNSNLFNVKLFYEKSGMDTLFQEVKQVLAKSEYYAKAVPHKKLKTKISPKLQTQDELLAVTLFVCVQELVKEITLMHPIRGELLLKAFGEFLKMNEEKWATILQACINMIKALESELVKDLGNEDDAEIILNGTDPTKENLHKHKTIIRKLAETLAEERNKRYEVEAECEVLKTELDKWVLQYDVLKDSKIVNERLEQYSFKNVVDMFLIPKNLKEEEKALIMNIERLLLVLPCKFRFEQERAENLQKAAAMEGIIQKLNAEKEAQLKFIESLQKDLAQIKEDLKARSFEEDKAWQLLTARRLESQTTQTDAEEFAKQKYNEQNIQASFSGAKAIFGEILENAKQGNFAATVESLTQEELLKIIKAFYMKLIAKQISKGLPFNPTFSLYKAFAEHLWERYELRDLAAGKCKAVLKAIMQYSAHDERIEYFGYFLGLKSGPFSLPEAPLIYLMLLNNSRVLLETFFADEYKGEIMFEQGYQIISKVIVNSKKEQQRVTKKGLFNKGKIYIDQISHDTITLRSANMHWILYKLAKAGRKQKVRRFLDSFFEKFAGWSQEEIQEKLETVITTICKDVDKESVDEFIKKYVTYKGKLAGDKVLELFKGQIEIKVDINAFLLVGLSAISRYVSDMKQHAEDLIEKYGNSTKGYLTQQEMTKLVNDIIKEPKENWKADAILDAFFRENKGREVSKVELAEILIKEPVMYKAAVTTINL